MSCCPDFEEASKDQVIFYSEARQIDDGPLMNPIISEYYLRKVRDGGYSYYAINYCPFCGKPRSSRSQGFAG
jgi:hypothetical protein